MQWVEQVEPDRRQTIRELGEKCGTACCLELLARARDYDLCLWAAPGLRVRVESYLSAHRVEAGGLLLGNRFGPTPKGSIVSLEEFVPGEDFQGTGVSLVMGTSLWDKARKLLDSGYSVIGWVHSHPNLGAFFSGTDRKTQRAFFANPWQVGLCIDPVRREEAWFYGPDSQSSGLYAMW